MVRARFVLGEMWEGLRRNLTMTLALLLTVAVSLTLFGAGLLVRQQVAQMKGFWFDKVEVSVFLCTKNSIEESCTGAVTAEQRDAVQAKLEGLKPVVAEAFYESPQEAFERFQEQFAGSPIADSATPEDLGESFRVKMTDPNQYVVVGEALAGMPGVERVDDQKQVLDKLFRLLDGLQAAALTIAVAMLAVAVLLVFNTVRLSAFSRRREIGIMRLVGASKTMIQLPFILETAIVAFLGSLMAVGILAGVKQWVVGGFLETSFEFTPFIGWDAFFPVSILLVGMGVGLSSIAAYLTLQRHLRV